MNHELGIVESHFADIVWKGAPMSTAELIKQCEAQLHWKRTTTYTVLKKLCERGLFQMKGGTVTALVSREDYYAARSERFVEETFDGSLPAFIAAFTKRKQLSEDEVAQIKAMIEAIGEEE